MDYQHYIILENDEATFIRNALEDWRLMDEDDTITHTAVFNDGIRMDIKCVGCKNELEDASWTEAVLFKDGYEIARSNPKKNYVGRWELKDEDGNTYAVDVMEELITKTRIRKALKNNIIRFDDGPDMSTKCCIGDFWFVISDDCVEKWLRSITTSELVDRVYDCLTAFQILKEPEYGYADLFLRKNGI